MLARDIRVRDTGIRPCAAVDKGATGAVGAAVSSVAAHDRAAACEIRPGDAVRPVACKDGELVAGKREGAALAEKSVSLPVPPKPCPSRLMFKKSLPALPPLPATRMVAPSVGKAQSRSSPSPPLPEPRLPEDPSPMPSAPAKAPARREKGETAYP